MPHEQQRHLLGRLEPAGQVAELGQAQLARRLTSRAAPTLLPQLLPLADLRNYLYNTDGLIFAEAGFPAVLFNEVMNRYETSRGGYHDLNDTAAQLDSAAARAPRRSDFGQVELWYAHLGLGVANLSIVAGSRDLDAVKRIILSIRSPEIFTTHHQGGSRDRSEPPEAGAQTS